MIFFACCLIACIFIYIGYSDKVNNRGVTLFVVAVLFAIIIAGLGYHEQNVVNKITAKWTEEEQTRKNQEKKLKELIDSGKADIFINGEPAAENFDLNGIQLKDYEIKFKGGKVYLIHY